MPASWQSAFDLPLAQELEPGAYQNVPVGLNVVYAGYGFSQGNVLFDAALPIEGSDATVHTMALAYLRTVSVFGRSAKFDAQVPVSWARFEGVVSGEFRTRSPQGLTDPRVRLSVNVFGAPALDLPGFVKYRQRTIVGASFQVALPLGQYDRTRFINLGAHRWSFRPEIALSHTRGRWIFEASAGTWLFTDNDDYPGGFEPLTTSAGTLRKETPSTRSAGTSGRPSATAMPKGARRR